MEDQHVKSIKSSCNEAVQVYRQHIQDLNDGTYYKLIKTEYERLRIWAGSLGVYGHSPASADDRLDHNDELKSIVIKLLSELTGLLQGYEDSREDKSSTEQSASSDSSLSSDVSDKQKLILGSTKIHLLRHVRRIISQLFSVLALVRRPSDLSSNEKVYNYDFQLKLQGDFESLISDFSSYIDFYLKQTFTSGPPDGKCTLPDRLFFRLKESAVVRRKALLLKALHRRKLRGNIATHFPQIPARVEKTASRNPERIRQNFFSDIDTTARSEIGSKALSATLPSIAAEPFKSRKVHTAVQVPPKSSKSMVLVRAKLDVPRPPKLVIHDLQIECYICYICGLQIERPLLSEDDWKKHVLQDIDPFVCLFECSKPDVLYKTPEDWYEHMQQHRMEWCCMAPAHRGLTFESQDDLEAHLMTSHASNLSQAQRVLLLKRGRRTLPNIFEDCPLCGTTMIEIQAEANSGLGLSVSDQEAVVKNLQRHIESHMYELALLSLPPYHDLAASSESAAVNEGSADREADISERRLAEEGLEYLPRDIGQPQEHEILHQDLRTANSHHQVPRSFFESNDDKIRTWTEFVAHQQVPMDLEDSDNWVKTCRSIFEHRTYHNDKDWHAADKKLRDELQFSFDKRSSCPDEARLTFFVAGGLCTNAQIYGAINEVVDPVDMVILPPTSTDEREVFLRFLTLEAAMKALTDLEKFNIGAENIPVRQISTSSALIGRLDQLSVTASVSGLLSLGLQSIEYLYKFYTTYMDRDEHLSRTTRQLGDLLQSLIITSEVLKTRRWWPDEKMTLQKIENAIYQNEDLIRDLQDEVQRFQKEAPNNKITTVRTLGRRAAYPFRVTTLVKLDEDVGILNEVLALALRALQLKEHQNTQHDIEEVRRISKSAQAQYLAAELCQWLRAPDATIEFNNACAKRHVETGQWFVQGPTFTTWLQQDNSFLWLHGFAGCGKSVLCSTAIQHTFRQQRSLPSSAIAFFFFTFADESKQDASGFLRALLLQLSGQTPGMDVELRKLQDLYSHNTPPVPVLLEHLRQAVAWSRHVYILLDALDESPADNSRSEVLSTIEAIRQWKLPGLHLLVTSRDMPDIRDHLQSLTLSLGGEHIALKGDNIHQDIEQYVSFQVENDRQLQRWGKDHQKTIKKYLTQHAGGVFRWVECQLQPLRTCPLSKKHLERCLRALPQSLDETYEQMLCNIHIELREEAQRIFSLLCFASRPLSVHEVVDALAIDLEDLEAYDPDRKLNDGDDLLRVCPGLIEIMSSTEKDNDSALDDEFDEDTRGVGVQVVQIAHFSVQEYLMSDRIKQSRARDFALSGSMQHGWISKSCLIYLENDDFVRQKLSRGLLKQFHFARYAAQHWCDHYRQADKTLVAHLPEKVGTLLTTNQVLARWVSLYDPDRPWSTGINYSKTTQEHPSPTYYAALLGLDCVLVSILSQSLANVNTRGGHCGTALQAASDKGHEKVVQILLDVGADVNAQGGAYGSALQAASYRGHEKVVQILLDVGADVNAQGGAYGPALQAASDKGHDKVVQILLDVGADVNAQGGAYGSALQAASYRGHEKVVQILLDMGADVNAQGGAYGSALQAASYRGHEKVVQMLLDMGADVNAQRRGYDNEINELSGLSQAASRGHTEIVQLLLAQPGIEVNNKDKSGSTPLSYAARGRHTEVVQLLLAQPGIEVNTKDQYDDTPLSAAAKGRHTKVV